MDDLDGELGVVERERVLLERVCPSSEGHTESIALNRFFDSCLLEVRGSDGEPWRVGVVDPVAHVGERVCDADAEVAAGPEHSRALANGAPHVVDDLKRVVSDHQVEAPGTKREMNAFSREVGTCGVCVTSVPEETGCVVERRDLMSSLGEVTRDAPFAASDFERSGARRWKN